MVSFFFLLLTIDLPRPRTRPNTFVLGVSVGKTLWNERSRSDRDQLTINPSAGAQLNGIYSLVTSFQRFLPDKSSMISCGWKASKSESTSSKTGMCSLLPPSLQLIRAEARWGFIHRDQISFVSSFPDHGRLKGKSVKEEDARGQRLKIFYGLLLLQEISQLIDDLLVIRKRKDRNKDICARC